MADDHQLKAPVVERPGTSMAHGFLRQDLVEDPVLSAERLLLVADKLARPAPRVGQEEVEPQHLDRMALLSKDAAVVGDIEGQDGQQATRVRSLLDNAIG